MVVLSEECESLPSAVTDMAQRRVLIAALTHIFMTGSPVKEGIYNFTSMTILFYFSLFLVELNSCQISF